MWLAFVVLGSFVNGAWLALVWWRSMDYSVDVRDLETIVHCSLDWFHAWNLGASVALASVTTPVATDKLYVVCPFSYSAFLSQSLYYCALLFNK